MTERFITENAVFDVDNGNDWADATLTPEKEEGLRQGRENARNGKFLTLAEFRKRMKCGA